ncbi:hypothetical protein [Actinomadura sp. 9N407]|uniref:hypothetical protein n=1 Tax=Actinomadura sp. 9N407 TaxID=3375154 RepID=UPI0037B83C67
MFRRPPLEERIAQRQAELPRRDASSQFDHPTAKALLKVSLVVTVAAHVVGGVLLAVFLH